MMNKQIVLASASPRRKQLLAQIGIVPDEIIQADINEDPLLNERAEECVVRLALAKAALVEGIRPDSLVLAADTIIVCDDKIMGKPESKAHAFSMWKALSDRVHEVLTCVVIKSDGNSIRLLNRNEVIFSSISTHSMETYWATSEPCDKAGAYAIQGYAAVWVKEIRGSYSGIMGLPLYETALLLKQAGIKTLL